MSREVRQFIVSRWELDAGAMFAQQSEPQGGAQPEANGGELRGAGNSLPRHTENTFGCFLVCKEVGIKTELSSVFDCLRKSCRAFSFAR